MKHTFRVAARALKQLGAEMITSDDVALNELIKNAFDAGSPRVTVAIDAPVDLSAVELIRERVKAEKVKPAELGALIEKTISTDLSIEQRANLISEFDKHLGSPEEFEEFFDGFRKSRFKIVINDTGKGMGAGDVVSRFLVIGTPGKYLEKRSSKVGDPLVLGDKGIGRLSMMRLGQTATVTSKRAGERHKHSVKFNWLEFDNPKLYIDQIEMDVVEIETEQPSVSGTTVEINDLNAHWNIDKVNGFVNKYLRRLQDPFSPENPRYPIDVMLNGRRQPIATLPTWLEKCAQFKATIRFNPDGVDMQKSVMRRSLQWRGSTTTDDRSWTMVELTERLGIPEHLFQRLGPFEATCLWFNRRALIANSVDRSKTDVTNELNLWCGGFAIYRDGFRVGQTGGMEDDWLEWDSKALKSKGYTLNRYQTVASVSISSKKNPWLVDAANRERLVACPEQQLLKKLLGDEIVGELRGVISVAQEAEAQIVLSEESTVESLRRSEEGLVKTLRSFNAVAKGIAPEHRDKVLEIRNAINEQVEYVQTIKHALDNARETRIELLELANIGQVVEIVIHELARLTESTGELLTQLKNEKQSAGVVDVIDNLRSQIVATNKRIRTVDALSPAGRNTKERYDAVAQVKTVIKGFGPRLKRHGVDISISIDGGNADKPLVVNMVRGLVAQVLENLLTNSIYWVQQSLKEGEERRIITVEVDSKALVISISDNGPGIDPKHIKSIFVPYFTLRRKGKGLGLYLASELAAYHGGRLYLDEAPDEDGRLRTFVLELPREVA